MSLPNPWSYVDLLSIGNYAQQQIRNEIRDSVEWAKRCDLLPYPMKFFEGDAGTDWQRLRWAEIHKKAC